MLEANVQARREFLLVQARCGWSIASCASSSTVADVVPRPTRSSRSYFALITTSRSLGLSGNRRQAQRARTKAHLEGWESEVRSEDGFASCTPSKPRRLLGRRASA